MVFEEYKRIIPYSYVSFLDVFDSLLDENGVPWAACPYCGKKAIPLYPGTKVYNLHWKCQNTKCTQKYFIINYTDDLCLI